MLGLTLLLLLYRRVIPHTGRKCLKHLKDPTVFQVAQLGLKHLPSSYSYAMPIISVFEAIISEKWAVFLRHDLPQITQSILRRSNGSFISVSVEQMN